MTTPLMFVWNGDRLEPANTTWHKRATDQLTVGAEYLIDPQEPRSRASHSHYFAAVNDAWVNLPEEAAERLPSSEHLRKFALIRTGHRDERSIVCASKAEAQRLSAFIRPMDDFAVVTVDGATVCVFTAKSQSMRAMGKAAFEKSKADVLDYIAGLIGTTQRQLEANAGQAA